jgi:hypothetical protein
MIVWGGNTMSDDFSGFKAMAFGLGAILFITAAAPDITNGHFDPLRLAKGKAKNGTDSGSGTTDGSTSDPTSGSTTGSTGSDTTTNPVYTEATYIPSNFDYNTALQAAWGSGAIPAQEIGRGSFRFICGAGQLLRDDPIVYPGQPGKSHLHQFYGNRSANANSTFTSLRAAQDSTCNFVGNGNAVNRSAYWMPAMLDGKGSVVQPDYVQIYYKRNPAGTTECDPVNYPHSAIGICVGIPNGLRFIFGFDMVSGKVPTGGFYYNCIGTGAVSGYYRSGLAEAAQNCVVGGRVGAIIGAPECWDGKNLDSPNHRDHVSYAARNGYGYLQCPSTHPYAIPRFQLAAWYTIGTGEDISGWSLSSDEMHPELPHGGTFHADYLEGWDPTVKAMWQDNCIDKQLNCSGGDLGNGKQLKGADVPVYNGTKSWTNPNRLVPIPA